MVVMGKSNRCKSKDNTMLGMLVFYMNLKPNMTFKEFLERNKKGIKHKDNRNKK